MLVNQSAISQSHTYSKAINAVNGNEYGVELKIYNDNYYISSKSVVDPNTVNVKKVDYLLILDTLLNEKKLFIMEPSFFSASSNRMAISNDTIYFFGLIDKEIPYKWKVLKFNMSGESIGAIVYDKFKQDFASASDIQLKGKCIYLYGGVNNGGEKKDIIVIKLDKAGNVIKEKIFLAIKLEHQANRVKNFIQTKDGYFMISNTHFDFDIEKVYVELCKFDDNLDTIWTKKMPPRTNSGYYNFEPILTPTQDSAVIVSTSLNVRDFKDKNPKLGRWPNLFYKIDKDGNVIWADTMFTYDVPGSTAAPNKRVRELFTASNGDIIGVGEYFHPTIYPKYRAWAFRYSPDGKLKWEHYYLDGEYYGNSSFFDLKEESNGDLICIGGVKDNNGEFNNNEFTWMLRLDSMGCFAQGCNNDTLGVLTDIGVDIKIAALDRIKLFPNPAADIINVVLPTNVKWTNWEIFNIRGEKVKSGIVKRSFVENTTNQIISINISGLNHGIYYFQSRSKKGRLGVGKFVVE